jgi:hypothetical protein
LTEPTALECRPRCLMNFRTAKALGLEIPDKLLARTDEVIE